MTLDTALLVTGVAAEATVLLLLLFRGIWRTLPVFCAYSAWTLASDVTVYIVLTTLPSRYLRFYLVESTVDALFQFTVLVELAWAVLRPVHKSLPRGSVFVIGFLIAVAGLILWPLAGKTVEADLGPQVQLLMHLDMTFAILRIAFFLVIASLSQLLSIGWRDRELQVATGLGIYSLTSLFVAVLRSHGFAGQDYRWLGQAVSVSYLCTLSYWVISFSTKEHVRKEFSPQMQQFLLQMGGGVRAGRVALTDLPPERLNKKD